MKLIKNSPWQKWVSMVSKPELFYNSRAVKLMEKERNPPQKQAKAEREKPLLAPHKNQIWFKIFLLNHCGHSEIPKYIYKDWKIYVCEHSHRRQRYQWQFCHCMNSLAQKIHGILLATISKIQKVKTYLYFQEGRKMIKKQQKLAVVLYLK